MCVAEFRYIYIYIYIYCNYMHEQNQFKKIIISKPESIKNMHHFACNQSKLTNIIIVVRLKPITHSLDKHFVALHIR